MADFKAGDTHVVNGVTYVRDANGSWNPANGGAVQLTGGDPMKPLDVTGKQLSNQHAQQELNLSPYQLRRQAAEAATAEIAAKTAQEKYNTDHGLNPDGSAPPADTPGAHGKAAFDALPANAKPIVHGLLTGNLPAGVRSLTSPIAQPYIRMAIQVDPSWSTANFDVRKQYRLELVNGKTGAGALLGAVTTALNHAHTLEKFIAAENNKSGYIAGLGGNQFGNWRATKHGDQAYTNLAGELGKYSDEKNAVYNLAGGSAQERQQAKADFPMNGSPEQQLGLLQSDVEFLKGKLGSLQQQGVNALGPTFNIGEFIAPEAKAAMRHFEAMNTKGIQADGTQADGTKAPYSLINPGANPPAGGGGPPLTPSTDGTKVVADPALRGANAQVRSMLANGISDSHIISYLDHRGINPATTNIGDVLAFRAHNAKLPPDKRYTGDYPKVNLELKSEPLTGVPKFFNDAAQNPVGTGFATGVNSATAGSLAAISGDQGRQSLQYMSAMNPKSALAGNIAGNVIGALATGAALKGVAGAADLAQEAAQTRRAMYAGNLLYGGIDGANSNPDHPLVGGALGAGSMAAGDAVGKYALSPLLRSVAGTKLGQGMFAGTLAADGSAPSALPLPSQRILNTVNKAGMDDVTGKLQQASDMSLPYSLSDAHPLLAKRTGAMARASEDVGALAEQLLVPRAAGQIDRALNGINTHLAPVSDLSTIRAAAKARALAASQPLYEKAMAHPAPTDLALNQMIATPAGTRAAREAYDMALHAGENPAELSFSVNPTNGEPIINGNPNWRTLQYMKMGLDKVVEKERSDVTGKLDLNDPATQKLDALRKRFVARMGDLNPDYRAANEAYGKIADQGSSAERGYKAFSPNVTPTNVNQALANTAPDSLGHLQQGYATAMGDRAMNGKLTTNPYQAVYGSPAQQAKVSSIFPQGADQFAALRGLEGDMSAAHHRIIGGSQTAANQADDRSLVDALPHLAMAATGSPHGIAAALKSGLMPEILQRALKARADSVGPALLNQDPAKAVAMLQDFAIQDAKRKAFIDRSRQLGGMFGGSAIGGVPISLLGQN